jgi:hypothetical protein
MKRWSLLFVPQPRRKRKRLNRRERYRTAVVERDVWLCLAFGVIVGGVFLYFILSTVLEIARMDENKHVAASEIPFGRVELTAVEPAVTASASKPKAPTETERVGGGWAGAGNHRLQASSLSGLALESRAAGTNGKPLVVDTHKAETIERLEGVTVAVRGFMLPLKMEEGLVTEFLLLNNRAWCSTGTIPSPRSWFIVDASQGTQPVLDQPVTFRGRLHIQEIRQGGFSLETYRIRAEP